MQKAVTIIPPDGQPAARNQPYLAMSAQDFVRMLMENADLLGVDRDDRVWLLMNVSRPTFVYLEGMDAAAEDAEDNGDGAPENERQYLKNPLGAGQTEDDEPNGDMEQDLSDFEPDNREPLGLPPGGADARPTALSITGGYCCTPKPGPSLLPRGLRKQLRALRAKRKGGIANGLRT